jgi:AsmA protein
LALEVLPFSPREVVEGLGQTFPVQTTDPEALSRVGLQAKVQGDPKAVSLSDGSLVLDDSKLTFSLKAKDFSKPDVAFALDLDQIDVDRYLPPPAEKPAEEKAPEPAPSEKKKTDYAPLRKLVLDGKIHVGKVKAKGANVEDINITITARDGVIKIDPFNLKLYQGSLDAKATMDVRQETPRNDLTFQMKNVQAGPLVRDFLKKDMIEGTMVSNAVISMSGDDPDKIKSTLNGKGDFVFTDGAIVGIDLPGMVRNVKSTFGLAEKTQERPKTDFSELKAPFTMKNGVVNTPGTSLKSPLVRVLAAGDADLVQETLDFRIEPKFVASLKGQGDAKDRSGLLVPVLVTGTFDDPKFAPDLKGMFQKKLEEGIPKKEDLKGIISGEGTEEGAGESVKEKAEGLIKGLFGQ